MARYVNLKDKAAPLILESADIMNQRDIDHPFNFTYKHENTYVNQVLTTANPNRVVLNLKPNTQIPSI